MRLTFPHFGDAYIAARLLFQEIGVQVVIPSLNSPGTLEEGAMYAPDEICLPFKNMIANLIETHKKGADTVVMPATAGPCRLGEYAELLKAILDENGYVFRWIVIDAPGDIGKQELVRRLKFLVSERRVGRLVLLQAIKNTYIVIKRMEALEKRAYAMAAYEKEKGRHKTVLQKMKTGLEQAESFKEAFQILKECRTEMKRILPDKAKKPIRVMLTGEIYSLIEPSASHHIEERLMDMGISFAKRMYLGWWIDRTVLNPFYAAFINHKKNKYLSCSIGGYAKESIEDGLHAQRKKYDGIIQIFPAGCMPEIVSKSVFSTMSHELDLRILTLIFDEISGEAGYITRLEAFLDMLEMKKRTNRQREKRRLHVLLGD